MKNTMFKKILSVALAAMMVFALCGVAFADGSSDDSSDDTTPTSNTVTDTTKTTSDATTQTTLTVSPVQTAVESTPKMTDGTVDFYIRKDGGSVDTQKNTVTHGNSEYTGPLWSETVGYSGKTSAYGNSDIEAAFESNFSGASLPDDASVFAAFKASYFTGLTDSDGDSVRSQDLDTENYEIHWFVLKWQSDAWHVDGVLVKKDGFAHKYTLSYASGLTGVSVSLPAANYTASAEVTVAAGLSSFFKGNVLYTFAGWQDSEGNPVSGTYTMPENDATLTATWTQTTYTGGSLNYYIRLDGRVIDSKDSTLNRASSEYTASLYSQSVRYLGTDDHYNGETDVAAALKDHFLSTSAAAVALPDDATIFAKLVLSNASITDSNQKPVSLADLNTNNYSINWYVLKQGSAWHIDGVIEKKTYLVTFADYNNTTISTNSSYSYGDTLTAPTDPTRDADDSYTYTFAGWTADNGTTTYTAAELPTVTADVTYTAVYSQTEKQTATTTDTTTGTTTGTTTDTTTGTTTGTTTTVTDDSTPASSSTVISSTVTDTTTSSSVSASTDTTVTATPTDGTQIADGDTPTADKPVTTDDSTPVTIDEDQIPATAAPTQDAAVTTGTQIDDDSTPTAATPKTGDSSALSLWLLLAAASVAGLVTVSVKSKKDGKNENK